MIGIGLIAVATVLYLVLVHRDQVERRLRLGLAHDPTTWSLYLLEQRARRERAEVREGIVR